MPMAQTGCTLVLALWCRIPTRNAMTLGTHRENDCYHTQSIFPPLPPPPHQVAELQAHFASIPNIIELESLTVAGDVYFGAGCVLKVSATPFANRNQRQPRRHTAGTGWHHCGAGASALMHEWMPIGGKGGRVQFGSLTGCDRT